jgi:hypothetical protein
VPHPAGLPDLFIDRSLGRIQVPRLLRQAGLRLTTLAERYGIPADEAVTDVTWLTEAGQRGEAVFMKDERVRYNQAEKGAIREHRVRAFYLSRGDLNSIQMTALFLGNLDRIVRVCGRTDWGMFVVNQGGLRQIELE